jgi:uncharacterized membrane protein
MSELRGVTLIVSIVMVGLIAGLFFAYACSVMPGLARADDRTLVVTMQRINRAIINPVFMIPFLGGLLVTGLAVVLHIGDDRRVLPWAVAAFVLHLAVIVVTRRVNIPLNNALDAAGDPDRVADLAAVRRAFEATWVRWNVVRALASAASFGCLTWALVLHGRLTG